MAELSNKTIATLLVVAIIVSISGTMISLQRLSRLGVSGFATSGTGVANLTISSSRSITVTTNLIDFGSGYPTASTTCTMESNRTSAPGANCNGDADASIKWSDATLPTQYFIINNTGNIYTNITFNASADASTWIGTDSSAWLGGHADPNGQSDSCGTLTSYQTLGTGAPVHVCSGTGLNWEDGNDTIAAAVKVAIPSSVPPGNNKQVTVTFYAVGN